MIESQQHTISSTAPRLTRLVWALYTVALVLAVIVLVSYLGTRRANHKTDVANRKADVANAAAVENRQAVDQLAAQVKRLGGTPVVQPSELPGPQGPQGPQGPGPSAAQVALAVGSYCTGHTNCTPTATDVARAVRTYCGASACRGPRGTTGVTGQAGATGSPGAQGPPPSDDQVADAVAAYCSTRNGCRGSTGPSGSPGPAGPTGSPGTAGEPPTSWTFSIGQHDFQCTRSVPFDPAAPTYVCGPAPTPTGTP